MITDSIVARSRCENNSNNNTYSTGRHRLKPSTKNDRLKILQDTYLEKNEQYMKGRVSVTRQ